MNLVEITKLINHPEVQKDAEMLGLYTKKRLELVKAVNEDLQRLGLGPYGLKELLLMSPEPALAETL